jgi:hypothetical protein
MKAGGIYACEDLHSSYIPAFFGEREACWDPDGTTEDGSQTTMQFFKRLADEVNADLFHEKYWQGYALEFVHFYRNIVFAKKRIPPWRATTPTELSPFLA